MSSKHRAAKRWYTAHLSNVVLRNEDKRRATRTPTVDLPLAPIAVAPSAIVVAPDVDLSVLRIVRFNEPDEVERRRAEMTAVLLGTMGTTSPWL